MKISREVSSFKEEITQLRRQLHQIPETAYGEFKTKDFILKYLQGLQPDRIDQLAQTGVKAVFYAPNAKKRRSLPRGYGRFARAGGKRMRF